MPPMNPNMPNSQNYCRDDEKDVFFIDAQQQKRSYRQRCPRKRNFTNTPVKIRHVFITPEIPYPVNFIQNHQQERNQQPYAPNRMKSYINSGNNYHTGT